MSKNFDKEISLIEKNDLFKDKLMAVSIINEFYNSISNIDKETLASYDDKMYSSFQFVYYACNSIPNFDWNIEMFMTAYFMILEKKESLSNDKINLFKNNLNSITKSLSYVNVIDKYDMSFNDKVNIMTIFSGYLNKVYNNIISTIDSESGKKLRKDIYSILLEDLDKYLNFSSNKQDFNVIGNLEDFLTKICTDFMIYKLNKGNLVDNDFTMVEDPMLYDSFDESEKKLFVCSKIYDITNNNDLNDLKPIDKCCEFGKMIGFSKLKSTLSYASIYYKFLKYVKNVDKESELIKK